MQLNASVSSEGAILLGKNVACDAFGEDKPLRVVTHAHYDHMLGLQRSLMECKAVVMTPATRDLIDVMKGPLFLMAGNVETLRYEQTLEFEDERLALYYADHILGSAQVLVEDKKGKRALYTSDFKLPETPIIETDVLVIEATYGNPRHVRPPEKTVEDALISLVEQALRQNTVYIFGYHGKLQEVMQMLHNANIRVPFIVPEKVFRVSKICERHGMRLGRYYLAASDKAKAIVDKGEPYIAFYHMGSRQYVGEGFFRIYVSGWEFGSPCREIAHNEYVVALSDHSDFNGLLQYVKESKPKQVITDNYRIGDAETLARQIQKRLSIPAQPIPTTRSNRKTNEF